MNSLYTQGVRQTNSIQADLERLRNGESSASLLGIFTLIGPDDMRVYALIDSIDIKGQISASLAAMNRTVDDYDSMAKREIIKAKQEKAQSYDSCFNISSTAHRGGFDMSQTCSKISFRLYRVEE